MDQLLVFTNFWFTNGMSCACITGINERESYKFLIRLRRRSLSVGLMSHVSCKGVDIINGEYPPGVFLRGLKFSDKKIRGFKILVENLRGLK